MTDRASLEGGGKEGVSREDARTAGAPGPAEGGSQQRMTLLERLRNPAYVPLPGNALALHVVMTRDTMGEAADEIERLGKALELRNAEVVDALKWLAAPNPVFEAAGALVAKLGEMLPAMDAVCLIAANHGTPYSGPTVGNELRALRDTLRTFATVAKAAAPVEEVEEQGFGVIAEDTQPPTLPPE